MKFSIKKEKLLGELQLLQGIVEKRNTMPILANILVHAGKGELKLIGTDLEVGMKTIVSADVQEEGAITISGKKVYEIVRSLRGQKDVVFNEQADLMMGITSGTSEFKVKCLPKEDYPQIPEPKFEKKIILPLDKI
ncbi:MAG: DNA polymerase III subunit beta, partial [Candidatus Aminicenantes bacterium]|nr:DNA polymerase III subunit beta [Candidatus Aminicenantes bacterium]